LAASNAVSAQNTPSGPVSEDFEEEEQKPSVQYLDSLNDYRKRSRSRDDEGAAMTKLPKMDVSEAEPSINGFASVDMEDKGADDTPVSGRFLFFALYFNVITATILSQSMASRNHFLRSPTRTPSS